MNDIEYDISYEYNCHFVFDGIVTVSTEHKNQEAILKKLKLNKNWYILKTANDKKIADKIAVCEIDNAYYFVSIIENQIDNPYSSKKIINDVIRIHKVNIKQGDKE